MNRIDIEEIRKIVGDIRFDLWTFKGREQYDSNHGLSLSGVERDEYIEDYVRERFSGSPEGRKYFN